MALAFLFTMGSSAGAVSMPSLFPNVIENDPPDLNLLLLGTNFDSGTGGFSSTPFFGSTTATFQDNTGATTPFTMTTFRAEASGLGTDASGSFWARNSSNDLLLDGVLTALMLDTDTNGDIITVEYLATITDGILADEFGGIGSQAILRFGNNFTGMMNGTVNIIGATVIPVPAALPLLLTAFGGLIFLTRRRRAGSAA